MKLIAAAALLAATPVPAQTAPAAPASAPVAAAPTSTAKFTVDTPIETIAADVAAKAALDAAIPGITAHPMYENFKGMSLTQLQPMSQGAITDETLAKAKAALEAVK